MITPLRELAKNPRVVAIGETGLDYHRCRAGRWPKERKCRCIAMRCKVRPKKKSKPNRDGAYKSKQAILFQQQLDLAVELGLNVVIHQRDAWDDTLEIMRPYTGKLRGVFHCFGGTLEQANEVIELDHLVSFTGIVTFKNGAVRPGSRGTNSALEIHGGNRLPISGAGAVSRKTLRTGVYTAWWQKRSQRREAVRWKKLRKRQPKPRKKFFRFNR